MKVVLLHALPLDERMWQPQAAALEDYDVIAPRLYGRGPTMAAWADSVAGEVDGELVLVGASMGGYCALALATRAPERVRALLLSGSRPDADSDERRAGRAETIELIRRDGADGLWRSMRPKLFADESRADERLLFRETDGLVGAVEAIRDREDSTPTAWALGDRLRFLVGESDPYVSVAELRDYDVLELGGVGHLASLEQPDVFNGHLREFLARV